MSVVTFKKKRIVLSPNDVATISYIKSVLSYNGINLKEIDVIRFLMDFFISIDEAVTKISDKWFWRYQNEKKN